MVLEIERKFLVNGDGWHRSDATHYRQGYLLRGKGKTIRVRVGGGKAFMTIKTAVGGIKRQEYEYEIPLGDGEALLLQCEGWIIE